MAHIVRSASALDIPGITEAYLRSWCAAYAGLLPPESVAEEAERRRGYSWAEGIADADTNVYVAVAGYDGAVVGVVEVSEQPEAFSGLPEVTMLHVDPAAWGTGVARDLLAAGTAWIASRSHTAARLRVVEAQMRARRFYEREGWKPDSEVPAASNGLLDLVYYRREL